MYWQEGWPPTAEAQVQFLDLVSHVSEACCWLWSLLQKFSPNPPVFLPPQKPTF